MTETTWAGRTASPPPPDGEKPRPRWIPAVGLVAVLGLVGAGGYLLGSIGGDESVDADAAADVERDDTETTAVLSATSVPLDEVTTTVDVEEPTSTTEDSTTTTAESDTTEGGDGDGATTPASDEVVVEVPEGETRAAVLSNGQLYLGGEVPSREVADQIIERAAGVVGAENIVDQYVINPDVAAETGGPLIVQDVVLFAYGSPTFDPQFTPLLDLGLLLLSQNPTVTVTIITHTDASGSESFNRELSYRRGQSVAQYWVDRGIPVEQIIIDARGEQDPVADNDSDAGAQLNRRAEFYIEGLLG